MKRQEALMQNRLDEEMINEKSGTDQLNLSSHYPLLPSPAVSKIPSDEHSEWYLNRQPYENYRLHAITIRIMKISFIFIIRFLWHNPDFQDIPYTYQYVGNLDGGPCRGSKGPGMKVFKNM